MAGPGIPVGQKIDQPVFLQDGMATSLRLAQAAPAPHVEFQDLMPIAQGQAPSILRDGVYGAYLQLQRAVTAEGFKLIVYPVAKKIRLFDLARDPLETQDLAGDNRHAAMKERLIAKLLELQVRYQDSLSLTDLPDW
jgi:choline-sulfatase